MSSNEIGLPLDAIGIIVLAAGSSKRFHGDKRQAPMKNGLSLLENTLAQVPACFSKRLLVLHAGDEALAKRFMGKWDIFIAEDSSEGMGNSLAGAMNYIIESRPDWKAALIGLGDMPFVQTNTYIALQKALTRHDIVTPVSQGKRGNPVGFKADYFDEIAKLRGDTGARKLIQNYQSKCHLYETSDKGIFKDIDTPDALIISDK